MMIYTLTGTLENGLKVVCVAEETVGATWEAVLTIGDLDDNAPFDYNQAVSRFIEQLPDKAQYELKDNGIVLYRVFSLATVQQLEIIVREWVTGAARHMGMFAKNDLVWDKNS